MRYLLYQVWQQHVPGFQVGNAYDSVVYDNFRLFLNRIKANRIFIVTILTLIISYNLYSSYLIGTRYLTDPRMEFQVWAQDNIPKGSTVMYSTYSPRLYKLYGSRVEEIKMPYFTPRSKMQAKLFKENKKVSKMLAREVSNMRK